MIEQLRRYSDLAGFGERFRWLVVVALALLVTGIEAVGALLVYVLLGLVTGVDQALEVPVLGDVEAFLPSLGEHTMMLWTAAAVAVFFVIRALVVLGQQYVTMRVLQNAGARLSGRLARGYLSMPYAFHLNRNSAELIRNAYTTVKGIISGVFQPIVKIVSEGLLVLGLFAVLIATVPAATLLIVIVLGPVGFVLMRLVQPRLLALGRENQTVSKEGIQSLQQSLGGIRDIKVLGREGYFGTEFVNTRERQARIRYRHAVVDSIPSLGLETAMVVFIAGLFAVTVLLEGAAAAAVPVLGLFAYAAFRIKPSLNGIVRAVNAIRYSKAGIDDIYSDLKLIEASAQPPVDPDTPALPFRREIHLDHVSFRYETANADALSNVDLRICRGDSIGVVGPTGGGKTTLVDTILGLLEPTEGSVRVDGVDIREHTAAWQKNVGMVPQSLFLVDDSLRRNIALGVGQEEIDEEAVTRAVTLAQLETFVASLPEGLDTVVGERGVRISGGQRQRVAIARALYRDPAVIVFDEGTSALDNVTEAEVLRALEELRADRTLIIVAHRLTTVRDCDRVLFVSDGRIADVGTYNELLDRSPRFREFAIER
jgi:ATP-binding cassette, subfamily B, bacterial PglK